MHKEFVAGYSINRLPGVCVLPEAQETVYVQEFSSKTNLRGFSV